MNSFPFIWAQKDGKTEPAGSLEGALGSVLLLFGMKEAQTKPWESRMTALETMSF